MKYSEIVKDALSYHQSGAYDEAKILYVKAIEQDPYDAEALQLLATILYMQNEKTAALQLMENSLAINSEIYDTHNNLANIYKNDKEYELALRHYKKALSLQPENALTYNNMAIVYKEQKQYSLALQYYNLALQYNENYVEAYVNLANLYFELSDYVQAIKFYYQAILLDESFQKANSALSGVFQVLDEISEAISILENFLKNNHSDEMEVQLAIYSWIYGDFEKCRRHLKQIRKNDFNENNHSDRFIIAYKSFLSLLNTYKDKHPSLYTIDNNIDKLYIIGDSHCLSYSNLKVTYNNREYKVVSKIIIGAKAWHLTDENGKNRYIHQFENIISNLEKGAKVILLFGEIDCRLDDGILKHHQKSPSRLNKSISKFVKKYVTNTSLICQKRDIIPMYSTVPAPFFENLISEEDETSLKKVIMLFNNTLKKMLVPSLLFDSYNITSNKSGQSNQKFHIDRWHLTPEAIYKIKEDL